MKSLKTNCGESISRMKLNPPKINLSRDGDGKGSNIMFFDLCNYPKCHFSGKTVFSGGFGDFSLNWQVRLS